MEIDKWQELTEEAQNNIQAAINEADDELLTRDLYTLIELVGDILDSYGVNDQ